MDKTSVGEKKRVISKKYLRPRWNFLSQDRKGVLHINNVSVNDLEKNYGTPLYIMVENEIRDRLRRFKAAFNTYEKLKPQYACKCNSNLEILKIVREEGFELDVSSVGEIILGLLADFSPEQITFTNLYKTEQDILFAAKVGVRAVTADSLEEIRRIGTVAQKLQTKIRLFIRINPNIRYGNKLQKIHEFGTPLLAAKYGIPISYAKKAITLAKSYDNIELIGFHFHGGYIPNYKVYFQAANKLLKLAKYCKDTYSINILDIDLGGGFPVQYKDEAIFTPEEMGKKFIRYFKKSLVKYDLQWPNLVFEPGKFIVANAGIGLVKIISKKPTKTKRILVTDGSTYAMLPDPLIYKTYYDILPATQMSLPRVRKYDIAGCTCDCIDILGSNRILPILKENDILAIMDTGAYSNAMASNFNNLKRPPMVMIKDTGAVKLIRRRDRYSEMFGPELDVLKVADPKEMKKFYNLFRINIKKVWGSNGKK
ncbi:diaminopimelate decarboxylase [Candidatus Woesearchaeota archaeon]|nr:diaminopimelate decarboxylase [Candidatus Woesearchaeota archaeon]